MKKTRLLPLVQIIILIIMNVISIKVFSENTSDSLRLEMDVKKAVLIEDWPTVEKLLSAVVTSSNIVHLKFIKAHTLLTLNKNNESLCYFLNSSSDEDILKWFEWTNSFLAENERNPVAYYFQGDSYARLGELDSAIQKFSQAIEIKNSDALFYNARGVAYSIQKKWDLALVDLDRATTLNSYLTDAFVNYGTIFLQKEEGSAGALNAFDKAIDISPDFVLALNGKACAQYASDEWDNAKLSFEEILKNRNESLSEIYLLVDLNFISLINRASDCIQQSVEIVTKVNPGMEMEQRIEIINQLPPEKRPMAKAVLANAMKWNQTVSAFIPDESRLKSSASVKFIGPMAIPEFKLEAETKTYDYRRTRENLNIQAENYQILESTHKNITAKEISNSQAFYQIHTDKDFYQLTRPGGVSTEEISVVPVDEGDWNVITFNGLCYK